MPRVFLLTVYSKRKKKYDTSCFIYWNMKYSNSWWVFLPIFTVKTKIPSKQQKNQMEMKLSLWDYKILIYEKLCAPFATNDVNIAVRAVSNRHVLSHIKGLFLKTWRVGLQATYIYVHIYYVYNKQTCSTTKNENDSKTP